MYFTVNSAFVYFGQVCDARIEHNFFAHSQIAVPKLYFVNQQADCIRFISARFEFDTYKLEVLLVCFSDGHCCHQCCQRSPAS